MAGLAAILKALARTVWRDLRSYRSLTGNNFFLFVLLLAQQLEATFFFGLILGLLLLFPLSADPLAKIPRERLELWPLRKDRRILLRMGSMLLSPAAWITLAVVIKTSRLVFGLAFLGFAACVQALSVAAGRLAARVPAWDLLRHLPRPPGGLGGLIQKDLRQMLRVLDFYVALLLSLSATAYRLFSRSPDPETFPVMAVIVVLALSTYAQCLLGVEWPEGWTRYRLMPLRGRRILLSKGIAFLLCAVLLTAPLNPAAGAAAALAALAIGHHASVYAPAAQQRWRFTGGSLFPTGLAQVVCMFGVGLGTHRNGGWYVLAAAAAYAASLWFYGRAWDRAQD